ncbi:MAG TPA: hypothetical protein PLR71_12110 [Deltaproteobacteria bacterium]|nr:hypothetical protein [Deltaproteobacteria bacterium]HQI82283.1 hypothetical protein [Deltaproteobacteria bacterium]
MHGSGVHCPDFTRDLTIRAREEEKTEVLKSKAEKGKKKSREIRIL